MREPPKLCDRAALVRHRARARRAGDDSMFLHREAAREIKERLELVKRSFTDVAIVTGHPAFWSAEFPDALVVEDTNELALSPGSHDLVVHAMALHWADDPVGQLIQARVALRPDGLFLAIFPAGQTLHELRAVLAESETELLGGLSPRVLPMADLPTLGSLLQRADLALPVADSVLFTVCYRDALHLMRDLRAMGETNAMALRNRRPLRKSFLRNVVARYAGAFPAEGGDIQATFDLAILTGWCPSENQPRPLRPGSAATRLADALGTAEISLKPPRADLDD